MSDGNIAKFAVIDFNEYKTIKELLSDEIELENYLDYLHMQKVKAKSEKKISLEDVKKEILNK